MSSDCPVGLWNEGVVPIWMEAVVADIELTDLLIRDLGALGIARGVNVAGDGQSGGCRGGGDELHDDLVGEQRFGAPVLGNEGEHAMLDAVPLAGARRVMGDGDGEAGLVGEVLQLDFPEADPSAIAATAIGSDQQARGLGIALAPHAPPPATNALDGEGCGVMVDADTDPAFIGGNVVDAVGDRSTLSRDDEVVHAHGLGSAFAPQLSAGSPEIADQLLLLGVDGDGRLSAPPETLDPIVDVLELCIAVRVLLAFAGLGVGLQAEAEVFEQAADQIGADLIVLLGQRGGEMALTATHPQQVGLRIASGGRGNQIEQGLAQAGLLEGRRLATTAAAADAAVWPFGRFLVELLQAAPDRAARYACEMRHHRDAAAARSASLAGGEQTKPSLIQVRRDCLIAHTNGVPVDHFINI